MGIVQITDESQLVKLVEKALSILRDRKQENFASVLALCGDLGAGKTTFVQYLARELGITEVVNSPTYVIMKKYEVSNTDAKKASPFSHLCHIDAYRVEAIDEMRPLKFTELLEEQDALICIEWAERIKELLPAHTVYMDFKQDNRTRMVTIS